MEEEDTPGADHFTESLLKVEDGDDGEEDNFLGADFPEGMVKVKLEVEDDDDADEEDNSLETESTGYIYFTSAHSNGVQQTIDGRKRRRMPPLRPECKRLARQNDLEMAKYSQDRSRPCSTNMSNLYDVEYKCKVCKCVYSDLSELKRHHREKHGDGKKLFKCEHCDYSSDRKADVKRHTSSRHLDAGQKRNFTARCEPSSRSRTSSPHRSRHLSVGQPTLPDVLESPHSVPDRSDNGKENRTSTKDTPPTTRVSPLNRAPPHPAPEEGVAQRVVRQARVDAQNNAPTIDDGFLKERISTVVFPDGRIYITRDKFEKC